jgi:LPS export ABC transporter protein LptC
LTLSQVGIFVCFAAIGCGERVRGSILASGAAGSRLEDARLWEERDGKLTLDLRARRIEAPPTGREASLTDVVARFDLPEANTRSVQVRAARGRLDDAGNLLTVEGEVEARDAAGRTLRADRARYDLRRRVLEIPVPVSATSPRERIRAARATFEVPAERLALEGGVEAEIQP